MQEGLKRLEGGDENCISSHNTAFTLGFFFQNVFFHIIVLFATRIILETINASQLSHCE